MSFKGAHPQGAREQRRAGGHLRRCSPRGLGPARLARSSSIHAVGRLIVATSWAICSFPAHACEQGRTHSAASPLLGRHTRGLDWGGPRGALPEPAPRSGGTSPAPSRLRGEIGRAGLSRQFCWRYSGIIGGFPPRPQSRAKPSPYAARCLTNKGWPGGLRSRISPRSPKPLILICSGGLSR